MKSFASNANEVCLHIQNGDINLAYRRFIDCALDADNNRIFFEALDFCNWYDENPNALNSDLLLKIEPILKHIVDLEKPIVKNENKVLNANAVAKKYRFGNFKLTPLSFEVYKNQIIGLVGENGNGKTTLLRILAKELEPDQGLLEFPFTNSKNNFSLRTKLVYIPQRIPRWYGTLMDNLHFTLSAQGIKNERNILLAEMLVARLGLRPYKNLGWNRISSGYKTRFELAKNLLREPHLLLLDEPLANLDILSQQTILQDLKHMAQSLTKPFGAVLSSQQLFEVEKVSDMVIFLKNGSPKYQFKNKAQNEPLHEVVFELEVDINKELLQQVFTNCKLSKIVNNGGVYIAHFSSNTTTHEIYNAIAVCQHEFTYVRNISHSSRRYFVND